MAKIKLLIVDDHQLIRDGLKKYIANDPDFELVGEAENGVQALEVKNAIKKVFNGETYMSEEVTQKLTQYVIKRSKSNPKNSKFGFHVELSERELEVLKLIVKEYSNKEIADKLFISPRTVDAHKRNMIEKTGSRNITGLIMYAINHQLFDPF